MMESAIRGSLILFTSRLFLIVLPTLLGLYFNEQGQHIEAAIIVVLYLYLTVSRALLPLGADLQLQRTVGIVEVHKQGRKSSVNDLIKEACKVLWLPRATTLMILIAMTSFSFRSLGLKISANQLLLISIIHTLAGLIGIFLSVLRNSQENLKSQIVDSFFLAVLPTIGTFLYVQTFDFSLTILLIIALLGQTICLVILFKFIRETEINFKYPESEVLQITESFEVAKISTWTTVLNVINSRSALVLISFLYDAHLVILFDLMLKGAFVVALANWSASVIQNRNLVVLKNKLLRRLVFSQMKISFALLFAAQALLIFGIKFELINFEFNESATWRIVGICFLAFLADLPAGVLGYLLTAKGKFEPQFLGQAIYLMLLVVASGVSNTISGFLMFFVVANFTRSAIFFFACRDFLQSGQ